MTFDLKVEACLEALTLFIILRLSIAVGHFSSPSTFVLLAYLD